MFVRLEWLSSLVSANQLTTAKGNSYLYDGHNRRVKQSDGNGTSYSMYSQDGTLLYREKGETITGNGTNYIYLGKKLIAKYGDVTPQTVNASRQHSRPFGESIEAPKDDVGYTGHKFDTDLGLSYMQARYYDPVIGRFYSNDPVGFNNVHSFNRYAYANNNPYKYVDPDGQLAVPWHGGITFFASIGAGNDLWSSLKIAYRSMQADWEEGSQGVDKLAVARHAMSHSNQSKLEAAANHKAFINTALNNGDLGLAAHAIQDQFAGGHRGYFEWLGGFFDKGVGVGVAHLWHDIFPSFSTISNAYTATKDGISGRGGKGSGSNSSGNGGKRVSNSTAGLLCGTLACKEKIRNDKFR